MSKRKFFAAAFTLTGTIVGAGILGLPYVFSRSGFFIGFFWLILLGLIMLFVNLCLGEISLRTKKIHQLPGYAEKYLGKKGTDKREKYENELKLDLIGEAIKTARKERNLTQEQLGKLVGVQKAQISKIENNLTDARFETILKVFKALNAKINFNVELLNQKINLA